MNREKAANLTIGTATGIVLSMLWQALYTAVMAPIPEPLPAVEKWYVVSNGEVIDSPKVVAVADSLPQGSYQLIGFPKTGKLTELAITISGKIAPTPEPKPEPPKPHPLPVITGKLTVLIIEEQEERTPATASVVFSPKIRDYLTSHCAKRISDSVPMWRIWDKDVQQCEMGGQVFCEWLKKPRTALPWIVISNGANEYSGELPKTVDATLELLKKYGGA